MRPPLLVQTLVEGQFRCIGAWRIDATGVLEFDGIMPKEPGVYAFAMDGVAQYVGVASASLAKRLYFYRDLPPRSERTCA
ncbi:MAG: hypothetical protein EOP21_11660 [Hyphomicrobiales bacterium]|nr:MAG: hypothetical protein EOP21_11660 [Hyphomicrobiales bacterium]